jgi:mannose-6-phosphate isomerase-like protein (cupin superfamily)
MPVINNAEIKKFAQPGLDHQTLASHEQGVNGMEVWMQTIAPGAATPAHRHACEEVIVVLRGSGHVTIEGEEMKFGADSTIIVPPDAAHQLVNSGVEEIFLIGVLGVTPVRVTTIEGERIPLPWQEG